MLYAIVNSTKKFKNKNMSAISIIVPVYRVEKYLHRCIDSILAQTFTDFECILIDDGSPDNCPAICDEYAAKDTRIIVIHQENAGVSAARNAGLDRAKGEWIGFVDSDDWCDPGMFEFLLGNAKKHKADISMCGYRSITEEKKMSCLKKCPDLLMNSRDALLKLFSAGFFGPFPWNKLVNKRLFSANSEKLRYDETIQFAEDKFLFFCLFKRTQRIFYSSEAYYNLCKHHDSVTAMQRVKGLTDASITAFDVHKKMLQMETDSKIRRRILAKEGIFAARSCLLYIKDNGFCYDGGFYFLKNIVKKDIGYIFLLGNIKQKIYSCLVFFPFAFYVYCKLIGRK
jgi:glycosyltransferase involved in cell wall biosynthesis